MSAGVSRCSEQTFTIFMPNWLKGHHSRTWGKVRVRSAIGLWVRCNSNLVWLFGWGQPYHLHFWNYLGWSFPLRSRDNSGSCQCWEGFGSSHTYTDISWYIMIYLYKQIWIIVANKKSIILDMSMSFPGVPLKSSISTMGKSQDSPLANSQFHPVAAWTEDENPSLLRNPRCATAPPTEPWEARAWE